jgi:nitric oxide reductase NorQ protein
VHPLADTRRVLPLERCGEVLRAHADFLLVASCNPPEAGLQKALKLATRQRFAAIAFDYPEAAVETAIVAREGEVDRELAARLVALGERTRRLRDEGLEEGASTRLLVHAARLVAAGLPPRTACLHAVAAPLSADAGLADVLQGLVHASFA